MHSSTAVQRSVQRNGNKMVKTWMVSLAVVVVQLNRARAFGIASHIRSIASPSWQPATSSRHRASSSGCTYYRRPAHHHAPAAASRRASVVVVSIAVVCTALYWTTKDGGTHLKHVHVFLACGPYRHYCCCYRRAILLFVYFVRSISCLWSL